MSEPVSKPDGGMAAVDGPPCCARCTCQSTRQQPASNRRRQKQQQRTDQPRALVGVLPGPPTSPHLASQSWASPPIARPKARRAPLQSSGESPSLAAGGGGLRSINAKRQGPSMGPQCRTSKPVWGGPGQKEDPWAPPGVCFDGKKQKLIVGRGHTGIEPVTSPTRKENHTTRPMTHGTPFSPELPV